MKKQYKTSYKYRTDKFEGPLDLLLFLVKKNELNVNDIPVSEITEQYLEYLNYDFAFDIEEASDFYLMAATLLHIKSKTLLPVDSVKDDDLDDPRSELVEHLIEYEKIRKLTDSLIKHQTQRKWTIERKSSQPILPFPDDDELWGKMDAWDLLKSFNKIMEGIGYESLIDIWEEFSINEKITLINEYIDKKQDFMFDELISKPDSTIEIVSSFLAVLEMVKNKLIKIFQNRLFGDIRIVPQTGNF